MGGISSKVIATLVSFLGDCFTSLPDVRVLYAKHLLTSNSVVVAVLIFILYRFTARHRGRGPSRLLPSYDDRSRRIGAVSIIPPLQTIRSSTDSRHPLTRESIGRDSEVTLVEDINFLLDLTILSPPNAYQPPGRIGRESADPTTDLVTLRTPSIASPDREIQYPGTP